MSHCATCADRRPSSAMMTLQQAIAEANRCMLCHDAPCSQACPAGTDPGTFIRQIRFLNLKGATRTVLRNNPLGGVCAYLCPTGETCRGACLRAGLDQPIDIDGLQRFAVEYGRHLGVKALAAGPAREEKVAVVGAGPAGLAAAARLAQFGFRVTLFETRNRAGGMLRYGIPASRLDDAALDADLAEILELGVELRTDTTIEKEDGARALLDEGYAAVFAAPGLWRPIRLDIPGMDLAGVTTALDFLVETRTAPAQAAALVADRNVAVIGGGSVAMDVVRCARQLGAKRIYAIALEAMAELPAQEAELQAAYQDGVIIKPQCRVTRVLGDGGRVVGVEGVETEWIEPGKLVPANARDVEGTGFTLRVGAVVQAVGQARTDTAGKIFSSFDQRGALLSVDERTRATSHGRVYAGGDIVRGPATVVAAVGDGKQAADAIHSMLCGKEVAR